MRVEALPHLGGSCLAQLKAASLLLCRGSLAAALRLWASAGDPVGTATASFVLTMVASPRAAGRVRMDSGSNCPSLCGRHWTPTWHYDTDLGCLATAVACWALVLAVLPKAGIMHLNYNLAVIIHWY